MIADVPTPDLTSIPPDRIFQPTEGSRVGAGDPVKVAETLVSDEQDAASDQMKGELLRLSREVARLGGETTTGEPEVGTQGASAPNDNSSSSSSNPTGT